MLGWITLLPLSCSFLMINLPPKRYRNKIWGILSSGRHRLKRAYIIGETIHKDIVAKARWLCERWTQCMVLWIKVCYPVVLKNLCDVSLLFWHTVSCVPVQHQFNHGNWPGWSPKSTQVFTRINSLTKSLVHIKKILQESKVNTIWKEWDLRPYYLQDATVVQAWLVSSGAPDILIGWWSMHALALPFSLWSGALKSLLLWTLVKGRQFYHRNHWPNIYFLCVLESFLQGKRWEKPQSWADSSVHIFTLCACSLTFVNQQVLPPATP